MHTASKNVLKSLEFGFAHVSKPEEEEGEAEDEEAAEEEDGEAEEEVGEEGALEGEESAAEVSSFTRSVRRG